jgi:hypothetical protein
LSGIVDNIVRDWFADGYLKLLYDEQKNWYGKHKMFFFPAPSGLTGSSRGLDRVLAVEQ